MGSFASKSFVLGAAAIGLVLSVPSAFANDDDLTASLAGNTMEISVAGMGGTKTYYADDGTFESSGGPTGPSTGTWEVVNGELCTTSEGGYQPGTNCRPMEMREVGESWEIENPAYGTITFTLASGKTF